MPGLMSQMLPLPVSVNEDLVDCILPGATDVLPSATQVGYHLNWFSLHVLGWMARKVGSYKPPLAKEFVHFMGSVINFI